MKNFFLGFSVGFLILVSVIGGAIGDRVWGYSFLDNWLPKNEASLKQAGQVKVINEENMVIDVVNQVTTAVVTVGIKKTQAVIDPNSLFSDPFGLFGFQRPQYKQEEIEQDIGSGFVVSADGLIVTNKHVVVDANAEYKIIISNGDEYQVDKIYRDPINDLAILKTLDNPSLQPVDLGDSNQLQVGQFVIAIGTALGEFRSTVTTGVISGLGRGIQAGDAFSGQIESLDNVIQTDAAINPGNSGGPLLNSSGQAIGVSVATTQGAENIGFAIPINIVKQSLDNFEQTGRFSRAFLGVRYKMIDQQTAILNDVPQGAYIVEVIKDSPAEKAGLQSEDIVTQISGQDLKDAEAGLAGVVGQLKVGEKAEIVYWRQGKTNTIDIILEESKQ